MKTKLIIGSEAARHWYPDFPRVPSDLDLMVRDAVHVVAEDRVETHWLPEFEEILERNVDPLYIDPNFLYTLKVSHAGWDIHWKKTMDDIVFLKSKGCVLDVPLYKKLVKAWIRVHGKRWASLKDQDSESFFDDAVQRKYIHDDIHEAVAAGGSPMYFKILKDDSGTVMTSKAKFNALTDEEKEILVREEVWVTAIERYLVPSDFTHSFGLAYLKSLKKLATTMSSGWFKMWIIDNFARLRTPGGDAYVLRFRDAESRGEVRLTKHDPVSNVI